MKKAKHPQCSTCPVQRKICVFEDGQGPQSCPTKNMADAVAAAADRYADPETAAFARAASVQEAECYLDRHKRPLKVVPIKTRVEEIVEFAGRMGYKRLGVAFCGGVAGEASLLTGILEYHGFEVVSVMCKVGRVSKADIGITDEESISGDRNEVMCNPIAQAEVLNRAGTDFNIMIGLCVGHDSLFLKHAEAYTTVFAVKDRVLGHNPMAALYLSKSYYRRVQEDYYKP